MEFFFQGAVYSFYILYFTCILQTALCVCVCVCLCVCEEWGCEMHLQIRHSSQQRLLSLNFSSLSCASGFFPPPHPYFCRLEERYSLLQAAHGLRKSQMPSWAALIVTGFDSSLQAGAPFWCGPFIY